MTTQSTSTDAQEPQEGSGAQDTAAGAQTSHEAPERSREDGHEDPVALRREAAMRRRQLRETEAERDALRQRLDERDRADVERLAGERFTDPRDVWAVTGLDELRADDGTIDMEKVKAEFSRIEKDRPHWRKSANPMPDLHAGARPQAPEPPSFGATVKKALGGG